MPEYQSKDIIEIITDAFVNSNYSMCAPGMRNVPYLEVYDVFKVIIETDIKDLKDKLYNLHKYHPNTIEMDKDLNIFQCNKVKSNKCNCWLPDVEYTEYYCYKERKKFLETTDYRNTSEYKYWRISVFRRDKYTCLECGQRGGELNAHHIKTFKKYPNLRYEINNGETLCVKCHKKKHRKAK